MNKQPQATKLMIGFLGLLTIGAITLMSATRTSAQTEQLPISTFLDLLPSTSFQNWFDPATGNILNIDAYGKRNAALGLNVGTTTSGKVTVTDLGDGTQRVTVHFQTRDAICWGLNASFQPAFGYSPAAVVNNLGPASLGSTNTRIVFEPQPIGPINLDWPLQTFMATVSCQGLLRPGSGFAQGTEGFAHATQIGLYGTGVPGGCPPEQDASCFPAETVQFKPIGN